MTKMNNPFYLREIKSKFLGSIFFEKATFSKKTTKNCYRGHNIFEGKGPSYTKNEYNRSYGPQYIGLIQGHSKQSSPQP